MDYRTRGRGEWNSPLARGCSFQEEMQADNMYWNQTNTLGENEGFLGAESQVLQQGREVRDIWMRRRGATEADRAPRVATGRDRTCVAEGRRQADQLVCRYCWWKGQELVNEATLCPLRGTLCCRQIGGSEIRGDRHEGCNRCVSEDCDIGYTSDC